MIDIFDFIDKGMEINTNELENLEAKALLIKIFEVLEIRQIQPGFYQLPKSYKKLDLNFYRFMRHIYKERFEKIVDYLSEKYPLKLEEADLGEELLTKKESKIDEEQSKPEIKKVSNNILGDGNKP
jgi:hypothetical protein